MAFKILQGAADHFPGAAQFHGQVLVGAVQGVLAGKFQQPMGETHVEATEGHLVAHRHIQKVFEADRHSAVAIAGTAGLAIEMVRLFQTELEHYEKIEGTMLWLEGKAT